jgi:hypothetical protein
LRGCFRNGTAGGVGLLGWDIRLDVSYSPLSPHSVVCPPAWYNIIGRWLQRYYKDEEFVLRWPRLIQASLLAVSLLLLVIMMQSEQAAPFVYQGFLA